MTKEEFKALIYPLSLAEVEIMSGYCVRTLQGWSSGRYNVPKGFIKSNSRRKILIYYKYRGSDFAKRRAKLDLKNGNELAIKLIKELS